MRNGISLSVIALFLAEGFPFAFAQTLPSPQLQQQAATYYRAGRYQESAQLYKQLADLQPEDTEILKDLMWASWSAGQTKEAMEVASKIRSKDPKDVDALNMLARTHQSAGNAKEAIENYKNILQQESSNGQVKVALARLYEGEGNLREAEKLLSQASGEAPGIREIYPALAKIQDLREEYKSAAENWAKAAKYSPGRRGDYEFQQAKALYQANETKPALALFRDLLQDKTQKCRALDMLVNDAMENGRQDAAAKLLETHITSFEEGDQNRLLKLARIYGDMGQIKSALNALDRLLADDPDQIQAILLKGNFLFDSVRNYAEAARLFKKAAQQMPENPKIYPKLATAEYLQGFYGESARSWAKAAELSPARSDYKFKQAQALYFDKQYDQAIKTLTGLLDDPDQKLHALDFLLGDFVARGDLRGGAALLERYPMEQERLYELAGLYFDLGQFKKSMKTIEKDISLHPAKTQSWQLKGNCFNALNKQKEKLKVYQKLSDANPTSVYFLVQVADAELETDNKEKALETLTKARRLDPADPALLLREAGCRFDMGEYELAKKMVVNWLEKNKEPALPVLLYHALTTSARDPLLSHPYHMSTSVFKDQIQSLSKAGFTAVNAQEVASWLKGEFKLPKRPVMITFDDGRQDSFINADPILKTYGMKATMFAIVNNVERNLQNYANWNELVAWKNTGRWDIQAHGDRGHSQIPIDPHGEKGFFIPTKMWLEDKKRVETDEEWRQRVLEDHESAKEKLASHIGSSPVAFAFPEGNYSQYNFSNTPLPQENIRLAKKVFALAFHEGGFGMNVRSKDPGLFERFIPGQQLKGTELVRCLTDQTPFCQARRTMIRWALWEEKPREAYAWLEELKKGGASEYYVLMEDAHIHMFQNDLAKAQELMDQALRLANVDLPSEKIPPNEVPLDFQADPSKESTEEPSL